MVEGPWCGPETMRILHINNYHFPRGGSDRYFLDVARGLAERGHEVRTLAPVDPRDINVDLRVDASIVPMLTSMKPRPTEIARFFYSTVVREVVRRVVADFMPDIVHLHIYYGQMTSSILHPMKVAGIPIVQTLHEYKIVCPAQTMLRDQRLCTACRGGRYWHAALHKCNRGSLLRSALSAAEAVVSEALGARRHVDRFLTVSDFQRTQLLSMGIDAGKTIRLYNFTDDVDAPSTSPGDYFLFAGRLVAGKGLETLLRAYKLYRDLCATTAIPLYLAGEGDAESELRRLAEDLGVIGSVTWLGHIAGDDLEHSYRNCRALVNPSEFNETFGLNNLEAMAYGRPVICSDGGAFPEVVRNGIDGFVVSTGNVAEFADRMCELTVERALKMGEQAHERAMSVFSKDVHLSKLERIYASTVKDVSSNQKTK